MKFVKIICEKQKYCIKKKLETRNLKKIICKTEILHKNNKTF